MRCEGIPDDLLYASFLTDANSLLVYACIITLLSHSLVFCGTLRSEKPKMSQNSPRAWTSFKRTVDELVFGSSAETWLSMCVFACACFRWAAHDQGSSLSRDNRRDTGSGVPVNSRSGSLHRQTTLSTVEQEQQRLLRWPHARRSWHRLVVGWEWVHEPFKRRRVGFTSSSVHSTGPVYQSEHSGSH